MADEEEELGGSQPSTALNDNRRLTGAQKKIPAGAGPERASALREARHADEKRKPGLREAAGEVDDETHQSDGVNPDRAKP